MSNEAEIEPEELKKLTIVEDNEGETEPEEPQPFTPGVDVDERDFVDPTKYVDYSDRGPNDVILSGPIVGGWGPGRFHRNRATAHKWCCDNYGVDRVQYVRETSGRWAFLIKNLKTQGPAPKGKNVRNLV